MDPLKMAEEDEQEKEQKGEEQQQATPSYMKGSNDDSSSNEYDKYLAELKTFHHTTAKEAIKRLYHLLRLEDPLLSLDDIYDRILKDLLEIWARGTIINNMPEELKNRERAEQGKKGKAKQIVSVSIANLNKPITNVEDIAKDISADATSEGNDRWTIRSKRDSDVRGPSYIPSIDVERYKTMEEQLRTYEDIKLENGRLKEQLTEQRNQVQELLKSVNAAAMIKAGADKVVGDTKIKDSLEYKTILTQLSVAQSRIEELEQLVKAEMKTNPSLGFQNASKISPIDALYQVTHPDATRIEHVQIEVTMAASELITFFQMSRNTKDVMYLQIKDGKVVGWESDWARSKKQKEKGIA